LRFASSIARSSAPSSAGVTGQSRIGNQIMRAVVLVSIWILALAPWQVASAAKISPQQLEFDTHLDEPILFASNIDLDEPCAEQAGNLRHNILAKRILSVVRI